MKYSKITLLFIAGLFPFMTLIVSGLSIYLINRNEIIFTLADILFPLVGSFLLISIILYFILIGIKGFSRWPDILSGILAGLSAAIWIQSQLLVWNFGQFNGQVILWEKWKTSMFVDGAVWIVIIGIALMVFVKGKQKFKKHIVTVFYILGLISVLISFINSPPKFERKIREIDYNSIFDFNPDKNVLVIILDEFQSDYFQLIANNYPREISELDGFTFYRNTMSLFPTTRASLPSIVTGALFRNEKPYYDYLSESYKKFNLIQAYKDKSYSTVFAGHMGSVFPDFIPMEKVTSEMNNTHFYSFLEYLDYSFFRALPTFLKPVIFNKGNWFFPLIFRGDFPPRQYGTDIQFLELLEKNASKKAVMNGSFKLLHFFIPHAPWCVDENLKFDPDLTGDKGFLQQARGAIKLASRILKTLKRIGIYDNSEIVIMSDHGTGILPAINSGDVFDKAMALTSFSVQSSSLALLLHKPVNARGKLAVSDIPLELTDLACLLKVRDNDTVCNEFNLAVNGGTRQRTFYYYTWSHKYWNNYFLPPITEYIVSGNVYDPESYSPGNFIYTSNGVERITRPRPASYRLGRELNFSTDGHGEADPFIRSGLSPVESYHQWSDGPSVGLSFHLEKIPEKDLSLRLLGFGYVPPGKNNGHVVSILVNHVSVGRWIFKDNKWYRAVIPNNIIHDSTINIVFEISDPLVPGNYKNREDIRRLGMAIRKMVLEEIK